MSVANTLGSNTFDILVGLGVPWFVKSLMTGGEPVVLHENVSCSVKILLKCFKAYSRPNFGCC